jgi:hypothetical protein
MVFRRNGYVRSKSEIGNEGFKPCKIKFPTFIASYFDTAKAAKDFYAHK